MGLERLHLPLNESITMITAIKEYDEQSTVHTWSIWDGPRPICIMHVSLHRYRLSNVTEYGRQRIEEEPGQETRAGNDCRLMVRAIQTEFGANLQLNRIQICGLKYV